MNINRQIIKVKDLILGYVDKGNEGVEALSGNLDIRPAYQREFVYDNEAQKAVIDSVFSKFPLGIMYWVDRQNGTYEVLDGQQRTLSICKFTKNEFSIDINGKPQYFDGFTKEETEEFLNYEMDVYVCSGTDREKLSWFERINIAGKPLTKQELRNATYTGPWLASAKSFFSKDGAPVDEYSTYLSGQRNRQDYLETVIKWISHDEYGNSDIEQYMSQHKNDNDSKALWNYFFKVMYWVKQIFPNYRKEMKGVDWGILYNDYKDQVFTLNVDEVETEVKDLFLDDEVQNNKKIFEYIFTRNENILNLRSFTNQQKAILYERQNHLCANPNCTQGEGHIFKLSEMEADHITPWSQGGKTTIENGQMLCRECNRRKSNK